MATATLSDILADGLCTIPEAAEFLRVSRSAIYSGMDRGDITYTKLPGQRSRRIPRKALVQFAARGLVGQDERGTS